MYHHISSLWPLHLRNEHPVKLLTMSLICGLIGCQSRPSQSQIQKVWSGGSVTPLEEKQSQEDLFLIHQGHQDPDYLSKIRLLIEGDRSRSHLVQVGWMRKLISHPPFLKKIGLLQDASQLLHKKWRCLVFPTTKNLKPSTKWEEYYEFDIEESDNEVINSIINRNPQLEWSRQESWKQVVLSMRLLGFPEKGKTYEKKSSPAGWIWTYTNNLPDGIKGIGKFLRRIDLDQTPLLLVESRIWRKEKVSQYEGIEPVISIFPKNGVEIVTHYEICRP